MGLIHFKDSSEYLVQNIERLETILGKVLNITVCYHDYFLCEFIGKQILFSVFVAQINFKSLRKQAYYANSTS